MDQFCSNQINKLPVNFDQFRAVTLLFIEGITTSTTTHADILDEESNIIQEYLSQLNRLDCVTVTSQPYEKFIVDGRQYRSRPFVNFYYPVRKINKLIDEYNKINGKNVIISVYSPIADETFMYNEDAYKKLIDERGYFPLHQEYSRGKMIEDYDTSFNPIHMAGLFAELEYSNKELLAFGKENLVVVTVIGLNFSNDVFKKLALSAHRLFFD